MGPATRSADWRRASAWLLAVVCIAMTALFAQAYRALPARPAGSAGRWGSAAEWPAGEGVSPRAWDCFRSSSGAAGARPGGLAARYRLAGTFTYSDAGEAETRKAVLDSLADKQQHIVGENDTLGQVRVVSISIDHVVLREGDRDEEIWLRFGGGVPGAGAAIGAGPEGAPPGGRDALATSRFGQQAEEDRWLFSRDRLLAYYQELLNEPQRLVKVFDSLKPVYGPDRNITGYVLGTEGEEDFFKATGLEEGDVVRKVNSMDMTNRRRAEYFIHEFVNDRVNVFVLDIERGGEPKKLIYEVR